MNLVIRGIETKNIKNDDYLVGHPFTNPMLGIYYLENLI
jgi:hypothetical protein